MAGRTFLDVARAVLSGQSEYFWRAAIDHAYYALFLECRDVMLAWGKKPAPSQNVHAWARLSMVYSSSPDLKSLADALDKLVRLRNKASYDLAPSPLFATAATALDAIQTADQSLALLDPIQADPQRRQAAIASLPP